MAWGLLALAPCPAFPQPLDHYCLTQIAQRSLYDTPPNNRQPPRLKFSAHGKTYYVEAHGANRLVLLGENNATLSEVLGIPPAYREWYIHPGDIQKLVLGKNGWLWVDSERTDYMVRLDTSTTPPSLGEPVPMPALTYERCGLLRWVVGCGPMGGYGDYSAALDRYFIVGYPQTFLGLFGLSSRVAYEVEAGQTKPLSINMHLGNDTLNADRTSNCIHNFSSGGHIGCEHFIDIPLLHSILYKGDHNEALLYDGTTAPTALD
jgi:hypothetical protein